MTSLLTRLQNGISRLQANPPTQYLPRKDAALLRSRATPRAPAFNPDLVTLDVLRKTLEEDQKLLSGNPIVKELVDRYIDIVRNVDANGFPNAPVEPVAMFRARINELTVGQLDKIQRKRLRTKYRAERKQTEKAIKAKGQQRFERSTRRASNADHR